MIFLLGNGFDLGHGFPTKYENFLHTLEFLTQYYNAEMKTIGNIFQTERLQTIDKGIKQCYSMYGKSYDEIEMSAERIEKLVFKAKNNQWFNYLLNTLNEDIGWIDFEKEIAEVVWCFKKILEQQKTSFAIELDIENILVRHVFLYFDYFHESVELLKGLPSPYTERRIKKEYCLEYPLGSGNQIVNVEMIIDELWDSLMELADMLREYLCIFVEEPVDYLIANDLIQKQELYKAATHIVSFNYTNTFEKIYGNGNVKHIHGQVDGNIVLGINSDEADDIESVDTSFLKFKKYFQRVRYNTDVGYLKYVSAIKKTRKYDNGNKLAVVGHSLDVTDKDIIIEMFDLVNEIDIFYHNENKIGSYIKNLVQIYGRQGFDMLRSQKKLKFLPLKSLDEK